MLIFLWILLGLAASYLLLLAFVAWFSIHPPRMPQFVTPGLMGEGHETLSIKTEDGEVLRAWWVPGTRKTTIIFAHGYFTNRCEYVPYVTRFRNRGASCLFFDHRAHGTSSGKVCTFGVREPADVEAAIQWVCTNRPGDKIVLMGNSMGAVACAFAAESTKAKIEALVLDSPYSKIDEAAKGWWTFFARGKYKGFLGPCSMFGRLFTGVNLKALDLAEPHSKLKSVPTLFLFARNDPLICDAEQVRCVEASGENATVVWFEKSDHARARFHEPDLFNRSLFGFLEDLGLIDCLSSDSNSPPRVEDSQGSKP